MTHTLDFWFDFASTYSFLSAKRIDELAARSNVAVRWRPFLLGPIFKAQGWTTSPFNLYPAKGRYMERDVRRIAATRGHDFVMPSPFPQNSLAASRLAIAVSAAAGDAALARFARTVFEAEFEGGQSLEDTVMLRASIGTLGLDPDVIFDASSTEETKQALRAETTVAEQAGIFGAPSFVAADGELFWGDDRLDAALRHALRL